MVLGLAFYVGACGDDGSTARPRDAGMAPTEDAALPGVVPPTPAIPPAPLPGFDDEVKLTELTDTDPDPRVLDVTIHVRVANKAITGPELAELYTYEGLWPGPLLRARVGDRLIVRVHNELPDATTIHWHGLEVPAAMDGAEVTQTPIEPGASFTYDFVLPRAGLFWYHPHVDSAEQLFRGLYGALLVEDATEPYFGHPLLLMLHDVSLEADGTLSDPRETGYLGDFFGREGDELLVNGRILPRVRARPGEALRLRLVNTTSSRHMKLVLPGHVLHRIGGDGGLIPSTQSGESLLLVPGERADVVVIPIGASGTRLVLRDEGHDRLGCGGSCALAARDLLAIELEGEPVTPTALPPRVAATIEPLAVTGIADERIELGEKGEPDAGGGLSINGVSFEHAHGHAPTPLLEARVGETHVYRLVNGTDYDHPFHLHGFRFQLLDREGVAPAVNEWKDTMFFPAKSEARIAVRFEDRPGDWMFHCHILDHAELGMMGVLRVLPRQ